MISILIWIYFISSLSISNAEIPTSVCLQHKPFKSKDGTCLNFNEVCLKTDDVECKAFLSACSQCPLTNRTFIELIQLLDKGKAESVLKFMLMEKNFDNITAQQSLAKQTYVKHEEQDRILLIIILILLFLLLIILLVEIRFKLLTKVFGCFIKRNATIKYNRVNSRKYEENMYFYETVTKLDEKLTTFVDQFEARLSKILEQLSKDRSTTQIVIPMTTFQLKDRETPFRVAVDSDDNIVKLKREICTIYFNNEPSAYKVMKLIYKSTVLDDNQYLLNCIPSADVIIDCEMVEKANASDILVVKLVGKGRVPKLAQINKQESVAQLKTIISKLSNTNDLMLFHESKELVNNWTLEECTLKDDDVVKVIAREQGELIVNFIFDLDPVIIKYTNADRVSQLKEKISNDSLMKIDEFILFSDKEYLDDEKFIFEYDISDKDRIRCCSIKEFDISHLGKPIAAGSLSQIFRTTNPTTGKSTIVKKYEVGSMDQMKRSGALLNELKRFQFTKSNTTFVQMHGIYFKDRCFYVEMEDTQGESMKDYLKEHHPLKDNQIGKWAKKILEGLNHLHRNGIYYRDLKATDILLDQTNDVKISGFGLSKYILGIDSQEMLAGIGIKNVSLIRYAAPELMTNQPIGTFTDVWSFGAILYRMVTNLAPYSNMNYNDVMKKIANNDNIEYENLKKNCDPKLQALIHRCLKGKPENRAMVDELLQDEFIKDIELVGK